MLVNIVLGENKINELAQEWIQLSTEGRDSIDCEYATRETIRNDYASDIYEYLDGQPGQSFDRVLETLIYAVQLKVGEELVLN